MKQERKPFHAYNGEGKLVSMHAFSYNEFVQRIAYAERLIVNKSRWINAIDKKLESLDPTDVFQNEFRARKIIERQDLTIEIDNKKRELAELRIVAEHKKMPRIPHNREYADMFGLTYVIKDDSAGNVEVLNYAIEQFKRLPTDIAVGALKEVLKDHLYTVKRMSEKEIEKLK